jgi:superfamily II DNA or RNA helicase/SAM-dependent methyltransferase
MVYTEEDLEDRMKLVINELKQLPTVEILSEVPYWSDLLGEVRQTFGSLEGLYAHLGAGVLTESYVDFPSEDQEEATTQILEKKKLIIRDAPGTGKSAPALKAIYALEQLVAVAGEKVKTIITAPNFVVSAWESKLDSYTTEPRNYITIKSSNRHEAVAALASDTDGTIDTVIMTYDAIFRPVSGSVVADTVLHEETSIDKPLDMQNGHNITLVDAVINTFLEENSLFYLIGDEIHHTNHPAAVRSQAFRKLALLADYFVAMTGTLFPNYLDDIYELISLMDNKNFLIASYARKAYRDDPKFIRMFLHRFGKNPYTRLTDIEGMPKLNDFDYRGFDLSEQEADVYYHVLNHKEFLGGEKFVLLRLVATDASLILPENYKGSPGVVAKLENFFAENPGLEETVRSAESTKYKELDALVEEVMTRDEKVVIFTKYREGITEALQERYKHYGAKRIDGSVGADPKDGHIFSDRDVERLEFQTNPENRVLIATIDSLREGQDVHSANNVVYLQQEIYPGPNDQVLGREMRRGQKKDVNRYLVLANGTIETGIFYLDLAKRAAIEKVDLGFVLTNEQRSLLDRNEPVVNQPQLKLYLENAHSLVRRMSGFMIGKGPDENKVYLDVGENAKLYAQSYNHQWEFSYSAHTARLVKKLVDEMEEAGSGLEKVIDLGSGPATVSRVLERPTTILDINPHQVEIGRRECKKLGFDIEAIVGYTEDTEKFGVKSDEYDLAVLSLNLHYGNVNNGDRKRTIMEANRALKRGGYMIITLPESIVAGDGTELLESGLDNLGFDLVNERTGLVRAIDTEKSDYKVYVAVARKREDVDKELYFSDEFNDLFVLNPQFGYVDFSKESNGNGNGSSPRDYSVERCNEFEYMKTGVRLVDPKLPETSTKDPNKNPYIPSSTPLSDPKADPAQVVDWISGVLRKE